MNILCNEANRASFLLVPRHGKPVYALALVNRVTPTDLYADTIEQVTEDEAIALSRAMDVEMTLADTLVKMHHDQDTTEAQRTAPWTPQKSPLNGKNMQETRTEPYRERLSSSESTQVRQDGYCLTGLPQSCRADTPAETPWGYREKIYRGDTERRDLAESWRGDTPAQLCRADTPTMPR